MYYLNFVYKITLFKINNFFLQGPCTQDPDSEIEVSRKYFLLYILMSNIFLIIFFIEHFDQMKDQYTGHPFKRHWWTKELSQLKKQQNQLSNKAYKFCHLRDHPVHNEYKAVMVKFKDTMQETRNQDWSDWLEAASQQDLYIANKDRKSVV